MQKRFLIIVLVIAIAAGFWFVGTGENNSAGKTAPVKQEAAIENEIGITVGKTVPVFTLKNMDGKEVTVGKSGKVTIINFWATWCPPCREEMPELEKFAVKHQQTVNFYALNIQEPGDKVADFLKQNKYTMPVLLDSEGVVGKTFRISAIPTTIVVDKNGVIKYRKSGGVTMSELEGVINGL